MANAVREHVSSAKRFVSECEKSDSTNWDGRVVGLCLLSNLAALGMKVDIQDFEDRQIDDSVSKRIMGRNNVFNMAGFINDQNAEGVAYSLATSPKNLGTDIGYIGAQVGYISMVEGGKAHGCAVLRRDDLPRDIRRKIPKGNIVLSDLNRGEISLPASNLLDYLKADAKQLGADIENTRFVVQVFAKHNR